MIYTCRCINAPPSCVGGLPDRYEIARVDRTEDNGAVPGSETMRIFTEGNPGLLLAETLSAGSQGREDALLPQDLPDEGLEHRPDGIPELRVGENQVPEAL